MSTIAPVNAKFVATTTSNTLAYIESLSPIVGDMGLPTDSPYILICYETGTWSYFYSGTRVNKPPSDWTLRNVTTSSLTTENGIQQFIMESGGTSLKRLACITASEGYSYTFGLDGIVLGANNQIQVGFYDTIGGRLECISWRGLGGGEDVQIQKAVSFLSAASSTPVDLEDKPSVRIDRYVKLMFSASTLYFSAGLSPVGPWFLIYSESSSTHFTTGPNEVYWGGVNSQALNEPLWLWHFNSSSV